MLADECLDVYLVGVFLFEFFVGCCLYFGEICVELFCVYFLVLVFCIVLVWFVLRLRDDLVDLIDVAMVKDFGD